MKPNKKELIEKGLLPENVDSYHIYKNGFDYEINKKWTLKLLNGEILCENVDECHLYENGFRYETNNKLTLKLFNGEVLCENVDCCFLYNNGFDYEINKKWTLKLLNGEVLCENVDWCNLFDNGFDYEINGKSFTKSLNKQENNMNKLEQVYMLKTTIGKGTEEDPKRILIEFFSPKGGEAIAQFDNWKHEKLSEEKSDETN